MQYFTVFRPGHIGKEEKIYGFAWGSWSPRDTARFTIEKGESLVSVHVPKAIPNDDEYSEHRLYISLVLQQAAQYNSRALKYHGTAYIPSMEIVGEFYAKRRILDLPLRYTASYEYSPMGVLRVAIGAVRESGVSTSAAAAAAASPDSDVENFHSGTHEINTTDHAAAMRSEVDRVVTIDTTPEYEEVWNAFVPHYMTRCFSMPTAAFAYIPFAKNSGTPLFFVRAAQLVCSRFAIDWRSLLLLSTPLQHKAEVVAQAIHSFCSAMPYVLERVDQYRSAGAIGAGDCDDLAQAASRLWLTLANMNTSARAPLGDVQERQLLDAMIQVANRYTVLQVIGTASSAVMRQRLDKQFTTGSIHNSEYASKDRAGHFYVMCVPNEVVDAWKGGGGDGDSGPDDYAPVLLIDAASPIPVLPLDSTYYRQRKLSERTLGEAPPSLLSKQETKALRNFFYTMNGEVGASSAAATATAAAPLAPLSYFYRFVSWVYEASVSERHMPKAYIMTSRGGRLGAHYRDMITGSRTAAVRMNLALAPEAAADEELWETTRAIRKAHDAPFWDVREAATTTATTTLFQSSGLPFSLKTGDPEVVFYRWHSLEDDENEEEIVELVRRISSSSSRACEMALYKESWGRIVSGYGTFGKSEEHMTTLRLEIYKN